MKQILLLPFIWLVTVVFLQITGSLLNVEVKGEKWKGMVSHICALFISLAILFFLI